MILKGYQIRRKSMSLNSLKTKDTLNINGQQYDYFSLKKAEAELGDLSKLPYSLKVLLENLLRFEDGKTVSTDDIKAFSLWLKEKKSTREIAYRPARVLMQDFTGVPAVVDLAAMRDAMKALGKNPNTINPLCPVNLVIDHSVQVDEFATSHAFEHNVETEMRLNHERYEFLSWAQKTFNNFTVVPPGTGICHQVNLEYLAKTVWCSEVDGRKMAYPDTLVGTDSHTTMINALGVLGWGVGGIEAEAAMLGQPVSMLIPEVVGFKLTGKLPEGTTATDLVLTVTQMLRQHGVVDKFVEFYGPGLHDLPLPDRATIANMAPEYGATCGFFPIDQVTIDYLTLSGRDKETIALVETYAKTQGLWHDDHIEPIFTSSLGLDLSTVKPSLAGPKRPQDKVLLEDTRLAFDKAFPAQNLKKGMTTEGYEVTDGDVVIAAITSCTNTSNPSVMIGAGLIARNALAKGLKCKPWVKTSLAPGSKVVTEYLHKTGLDTALDQLGFNLVGYGCTTCIGNSGPLPAPVEKVINENDLTVAAVLSGNRNFEGRIHPQVKANWLASPMLVVGFALAGSIHMDLTKDPLGTDAQGKPVYLKDLWPSSTEIAHEVAKVTQDMFRQQYANVYNGNEKWNAIKVEKSETYHWNEDSTYVRLPNYFENLTMDLPPKSDIKDARILALFGDSITTDHISPAGSIKADSPAGKYLQAHGVEKKDFNSYGSRRGNHEVMMRGTFANIRIKNEMMGGAEGGMTQYFPSEEIMSIYDAAMKYKEEKRALIVIAGKEYGTGSSRDWAAKGTLLLGVKAVLAESFERIHRSNLIGMGVLPLQFQKGTTRKSLELTGNETIDVLGINHQMKPGMEMKMVIHYADGQKKEVPVTCRINTQDELDYYFNDGILHYVLRKMAM
jgi:aconitate hydratase